MIQSILDNDLYKFTMQNAVLDHYPDAHVTYQFTNRNQGFKFDLDFYDMLGEQIDSMANLKLTSWELAFLKERCPYLSNEYLNYLKDYRYNPHEVEFSVNQCGNLELQVMGPWHSTILWEVPLLAIISESYFKTVDTNWSMRGQEELAKSKAEQLSQMKSKFTDFGTRRRRSFKTQDLVVKTFVESGVPNFFGTSNVHLAHKYNTRAIGTMAHEWIMGISGLNGVKGANKLAMEKWVETYGTNLGFALTDTFGTDIFFKEFNGRLSNLYDGLRQDSGSPYQFMTKALAHYKRIGIDPRDKTIIFSDSLDVKKALMISRFCSGYIGCSFGIGTHFTNDFANSPALNIVIKLSSINGTPVVKLSDDYTKHTGDKEKLIEVLRILGDNTKLTYNSQLVLDARMKRPLPEIMDKIILNYSNAVINHNMASDPAEKLFYRMNADGYLRVIRHFIETGEIFTVNF